MRNDISGCRRNIVTIVLIGMLPQKLQSKIGQWQHAVKSFIVRQTYIRRSLFKLEFKGNKILLLCSKLYISVGGGENKLAHKGVQNRNNLQFEHYKKVLDESTQIGTVNKGIRVWNKTVTTYEQTKIGLTSIYIKRKVHSDGISTSPLSL